MPVVLFTCAGQRVDIVTAFGRAGATTLAVDLERARAGALRRRPPRARAARSTTPATSRRSRALVARARRAALVVPLADLDHRVLAGAPRRARRARAAARPRDDLALRGQVRGAPLLRASTGIAVAADLAAGRAARRPRASRCSSRRAAASARATSTAPPTARELDFFLGYTTAESMVQQVCAGEEFSIDVFCDLEGRCLERDPAHDDRVEGRRVDQGHDDQGRRS